MMYQEFYLPSYDWRFIIYYNVSGRQAWEILEKLRSLGASGRIMKRAEDNLFFGGLNSGFTCTMEQSRTSLIVIGQVTSAAEFWNTFDHEKGHASTHVAEALGLDPNGEERQYLSGTIAKEAFKVARLYVCDKCM